MADRVSGAVLGPAVTVGGGNEGPEGQTDMSSKFAKSGGFELVDNPAFNPKDLKVDGGHHRPMALSNAAMLPSPATSTALYRTLRRTPGLYGRTGGSSGASGARREHRNYEQDRYPLQQQQ